jgi:hypothetical protein
MKSTLLLLGLLSLSLAQAEEIKIMDLNKYDLSGSTSVRSQFEVNEELGRAWVKVTLVAWHPDDAGDAQSFRVKVPGLSYDADSGSIILTRDGEITECARVEERGRSVFRRKVIEEKKCEISGRWKRVTYDDGFEIQETEKYEIFLAIE